MVSIVCIGASMYGVRELLSLSLSLSRSLALYVAPT